MLNKDALIQDKEVIKKNFESNYTNIPVFMVYNGKQFPVKVISINNDTFIIRSVGRSDSEERIISFTNDDKLYKFTFKFLGTNGNFEILQPVALKILPAARLLSRIQSNKLYITNISNQSDIAKSLVSDSVRINTILKGFSSKVKDKISTLELFIHERVDVRLKLLNDHEKIIFIPDKSNAECVPKDCVTYVDYMNQLRNAKGNEKIVSEITLPMKFRNIFTFGYLTAQNEIPMDEGFLKIINALSSNIKKEIFSKPIINESKEASLILDINSEGFSIFHSNFANFGKLFSIGAIIIFELCASAEEKITCRASIRYIKPTEKQFRIGCQFFTTSEEESKDLINYIKKHIPNLEIKEKLVEAEKSDAKPTVSPGK